MASQNTSTKEVAAKSAKRSIRSAGQPGVDRGLTVAQAAHVAKVDPNHRLEMADLLRRGVAVGIGPQRECGPDVPPIAIWVAENPEFWIDCCETVAAAKSYAASLGLPVAHVSAVEDVR